MDTHHPDMHTLGTNTVAIAAVQRASLSGQGLGPVRTELEAELRGLCMAAKMHGYFVTLNSEGVPVIATLPGKGKKS